jgi:hypothetical protein
VEPEPQEPQLIALAEPDLYLDPKQNLLKIKKIEESQMRDQLSGK